MFFFKNSDYMNWNLYVYILQLYEVAQGIKIVDFEGTTLLHRAVSDLLLSATGSHGSWRNNSVLLLFCCSHLYSRVFFLFGVVGEGNLDGIEWLVQCVLLLAAIFGHIRSFELFSMGGDGEMWMFIGKPLLHEIYDRKTVGKWNLRGSKSSSSSAPI